MCKFDCAVYHCGHMTYTARDSCDGYYISETEGGERFGTCSSFITPKHIRSPPPHAIVDTQFYKNRICGRVDCGYKPEDDPFCRPLDAPLEVGPPGAPKRKQRARSKPPKTPSRTKRVKISKVCADWAEDEPPPISRSAPAALEPFEPDPAFRVWSTPPSLKRGKTFPPPPPPPSAVRDPVIPVVVRDGNDPTPEPRCVRHTHITPIFPRTFLPNSFPGIPLRQVSPSPRRAISTGGLKNIRMRQSALGGAALLRVMLEDGDDNDTPTRMSSSLERLSLEDQAAGGKGKREQAGTDPGKAGLANLD